MTASGSHELGLLSVQFDAADVCVSRQSSVMNEMSAALRISSSSPAGLALASVSTMTCLFIRELHGPGCAFSTKHKPRSVLLKEDLPGGGGRCEENSS